MRDLKWVRENPEIATASEVLEVYDTITEGVLFDRLEEICSAERDGRVLTKEQSETMKDALIKLNEYEMAEDDGMLVKLNNIPEDARIKILETINRIKNEGQGGLICILL
jgi:hypothetical protein